MVRVRARAARGGGAGRGRGAGRGGQGVGSACKRRNARMTERKEGRQGGRAVHGIKPIPALTERGGRWGVGCRVN